MMKKLLLLISYCLLSASLTFSGLLFAAEPLDSLRASGAVAERYDGFLGARKNSDAVKEEVAKINAQRKKIYRERAASQGVDAAQVGRVYAKEIYKSAPEGTLFLRENGKTIRK